MTFNDLKGQNHIAYSAIRPNMSMYAKYQVNPCSGFRQEQTDTHTLHLYIYMGGLHHFCPKYVFNSCDSLKYFQPNCWLLKVEISEDLTGL